MSRSKTAVVPSKVRKSRAADPASARSKRAAIVERDGLGVITVTMRGKSGALIILRSSQSGRFTTRKSARVIDRGVERFAGPLRRLATK